MSGLFEHIQVACLKEQSAKSNFSKRVSRSISKIWQYCIVL